jgi:hypothetical protein
MKTWKLVSGILSIILFVLMMVQSCTAGLLNIVLSTGESSGTAGVMAAFFILAGGIVSVSTRNGGKGGDIALIVLFGIAALIGLTMAGTIYLDLYAWALWGVINAILALVSLIQKSHANAITNASTITVKNNIENVAEKEEANVVATEAGVDLNKNTESVAAQSYSQGNVITQQNRQFNIFIGVLVVVILCIVCVAFGMNIAYKSNSLTETTEQYVAETTQVIQQTVPATVIVKEPYTIAQTEEVYNSDEYLGNVKADNYGDIFPESDREYLTRDDVYGMDKETIRLGLNEVYARHGRMFNDKTLQAYFNNKSWYVPVYTPDEFSAIENNVFNEYEKANVRFLAEIKDSM